MTNLQKIAVGGIMLVVMTTVSVTFVADGLNIYSNTANQVSQGELNQIKNISDADINQISDTAQQEADNVQPKASFFTLPGLVNTFGIVFQVIPVFESLVSTSITVLGLGDIPIIAQGAFAIIGVIVAFTFARRVIS